VTFCTAHHKLMPHHDCAEVELWLDGFVAGLRAAGVPIADDPPERPSAATPPRARVAAPSITCPRCGATSYHPEDVREGYCGRCHEFTGRPALC
jgi:ribosomal protein S27AE